MKKNLLKVKAFLESKKTALVEQKKSAALTDEQKSKIEEAMGAVQDAINALDAAEEEATNEQIIDIFAKAMESLSTSTDVAVQAIQAEVQAKLAKMQAKLEKGTVAPKKVVASMSLKKLRASTEASSEGFKPYTAGVDVSTWTPESEVERVETFHTLIGVAAGLEVSTTSNTSIKVRKMAKGSGATAVVLNHGVKPVIEYVGAQNIVTVDTYAGVVEGIADEDLEDNPGLESELQMEALEDLASTENTAALALLVAAGQAYSNANYGTVAYADAKAALAGIIDQVRQALGRRQSPICLAMNSSQWAKLKDLRNENGTPIDIQSVIGDVEQIVDNSLTTDNFLCWAKKYAKLKVYKGKVADWYKGVKVVEDNGAVTAVYSEWRTDESSLRVRQRQVMYVTDNTTVVKGTLSGVVTAITAEPEIEA